MELFNDIFKIINKGEIMIIGDKFLLGMVGNFIINFYDDDWLMLVLMFMVLVGLVYNKIFFIKNGWMLLVIWDEFFVLGDEVKVKGVLLFIYLMVGYFDIFFFVLLLSIGGDDYFKKVMSYEKNIWIGSEVI